MFGHCSFDLDGKLCVFGGQITQNQTFDKFLLISQKSAELVQYDAMVINPDELLSKKVQCTSTMLDSTLFVVGGKKIERFDEETNENNLIHGISECPVHFTKSNVELSSDLVLTIFSFLNRGDLAVMTQVCRLFHQCATSNYIWKSEFEKYYQTEPMEGNARKLFGRRQMLDRLWFEGKPTTVKIEEIKSGVALLKFQRSKVFPDGTGVLAMGLTSGEVNLMKITSNDELKPWHVLKPREDPTYCINFDPSRMGNILVSSGSRSEVVVCNMDSGEVISHWNSNQKVVWNVSILDSSCIATCGEDSTIKLWDIHTQQLIHKFTHDLDHSQPIYDCATNDKTPSSNIIVSACQDRTVKVFDKRSGNCEALMKTSTCNFEVNLFGDSQVTCGGYSVISVFDLRKPEVLKASSIVFNDTTGSYPVRGLSVNGTRTVCGSRCEIDILSSHTDILRHYDRKSDPLHVINTMKCKDVLTLYSDDEYLMCGGLDGVTVSCFSKPIGKLNVSLDEKKEIKKKNCTIQ